MSFKLLYPSFRVASMHSNELTNINVKYKTLYGINANNMVVKDRVEMRLEGLLKID